MLKRDWQVSGQTEAHLQHQHFLGAVSSQSVCEHAPSCAPTNKNVVILLTDGTGKASDSLLDTCMISLFANC